MKNKLILVGIFVLVLVAFSSFTLAEEHDEIEIFGLELEKLLNLGSGLLAGALSLMTFISYNRSKNKRLLYVSVAFILFAVKSLLSGSEIFFGEWPFIDPLSSIFDFAILLSFFLGILKK